MEEPKRKIFRWECPNCGNWLEVVPPDNIMEVPRYICSYDGFIMILELIDKSKRKEGR